jgi:hypothetical protein
MKKMILLSVGLILLTGCFNKEVVKKDYSADYKNIEKNMLAASKKFMNTNKNLIPTDNQLYSIKLDSLYVGEFLKDKLIDPELKTDCDKDNSYIHVKNNNGNITYTVFLMCGNYQTKLK